jgi:glycosyltransferase involved in cell wall biosynthesis
MGMSASTINQSLRPSVSVVMPIYNRANFLHKTLHPLFNQTYPTECYEIILVDDGSTDETVSRAKSLAAAWAGRFRVIEQRNQGPGAARNAGLYASNAEIVAFIDSDCIADLEWLDSMVRVFETTPAVGIGGGIINIAEPDTWVSRYLVATNEYRHRVKRGEVDYLITPNASFRRAAILEVGGFTSSAKNQEDYDISLKLKDAGYQLAIAEYAHVVHTGVPSTVRLLFLTHYRYGIGSYQLSKHWKRNRSPLVELIRHVGAMVLSPVLALSLIKKVGLVQAISFWPLVVIKHGAFAVGLISAIFKGAR